MRRIARAALAPLLVLLLMHALPARAEDVRLHLIARGALNLDIVAAHVIDGAHFCSAAADPWSAPLAGDARATPFPFYRLVFGQAAPGADLARPGPSLGLALSNYFAAARDHSDPINDSIELVLQGRHFIGHADMQDAGYRLAVSYREDRRGGGFVARRLHETGGGQAALDVQGTWECPAVAADVPEIAVTVHALFRGAAPVRSAPAQLRVARSDIPCLDRGCAGWRVTDEATGAAWLAQVDFTHLRLARALRREAEGGQVDLLISGTIRRGDPPHVRALLLDGVAPAAPRLPPDEPGRFPEASLPLENSPGGFP